jgi:hypothetical protein
VNDSVALTDPLRNEHVLIFTQTSRELSPYETTLLSEKCRNLEST